MEDDWTGTAVQVAQGPDGKQFEKRLFALFERKQMAAKRPGVSYEVAFKDLHVELGRRYQSFEAKGIDWEAVGAELAPRAATVKDDTEFGLLVRELVARLRDSHAYVGQGLIDPPSYDFPRWDPGFACLIDDRGKPVVPRRSQ